MSRLTPAGALSGHPQTKPCRVGSRSVNVKEARKHPLEKKKKKKESFILVVGTTTVLQPSTAATTPSQASQTVLQGGEGQDGDHNTWQQRCCMVTVPQCRLVLQQGQARGCHCRMQGRRCSGAVPRAVPPISPHSPPGSCFPTAAPVQGKAPAALLHPALALHRGSQPSWLTQEEAALLSLHCSPTSPPAAQGCLQQAQPHAQGLPGAVLPCWLLANNHHTS